VSEAEPVTIDSSRRTAHEIFDKAAENAEDELSRSSRALAVSGLTGGVTMGLTGLAVASVRAILGQGPTAELVAFFFYPIGFIAVIIGRAQLFTENTLYPVVLVLTDHRHIRNTLRLWGIVFVANVAGAFLFALLASHTSSLEPKIAEELVKLGIDSVSMTTSRMFWSGVFGGWLIALVAWMVSASHWTIGQIAVVWLLTFLVGIARFAHCIATSGEIITAALAGAVPISSYLHWLLFATLGNIVGGVSLVSLMNWGQVHAGEEQKPVNGRRKARLAA